MASDKTFLRTFPQTPIDSDLRFRYGGYIKEKPGLGGPGLAITTALIRDSGISSIIADFTLTATQKELVAGVCP